MRFSRICLFILLLAITAEFSAPGTAWALFGKSQAVAAPPQFPIHDEASFNADTKSFHQIPFNDPKLEFDILLPKNWETETILHGKAPDQGQEVLSDIARFKSPLINTAQAIVTIQSARLDHEISAGNWLKNYVFTNGYSLQEKVTYLGDKKATASFISVSEGRSTYTYTSLQISGNLAVMARFEVPLSLKDFMNFLIERSINSFRTLLSTDEAIEVQKIFSLPDALKITYPESWGVHYQDFKTPHNMSVQIHNETPSKKVEGLIRFIAVRRTPQTNLGKELDSIKKYFGDIWKIEFKKLVSSGNAQTSDRFIFSRYEVYRIGMKEKDTADQELRFVILGDKDWYIFMFLITPTESDTLYTWAHNTRTFDLIVKNLK